MFLGIVLIIKASKEMCFSGLYWSCKRVKRCVVRDCIGHISE